MGNILIEYEKYSNWILEIFFFQDADADGSGSVDFSEFVGLMIKVTMYPLHCILTSGHNHFGYWSFLRGISPNI